MDTKLGVNWKGSLEFLLTLQSNVYVDYNQVLLSIKGYGNLDRNLKLLHCSLSTYYISIISKFQKYLEKKKDIKYNYKELTTKQFEQKDILDMVRVIMEFSQEAGISAINVKDDVDPNEALGH